MRLAIFSHCTVDSITVGGRSYEQIGGAACYCGITARQLRLDVDLYTKFGPGFARQYLDEHKIRLFDPESDRPTTRFAIDVDGTDRTLRLEDECEPVRYDGGSDADGYLVSPVYHEITDDVLGRIRRDAGFLFVDPQGFLRQKDGGGNVMLARNDALDLSGVGAIKASPDEARQLVGGTHDEMMLALQKKGAEHVLLTDKADVSLLVGDKIYSIRLPDAKIHDTTGAGDIFCSAFACTMLRERDFLWALCFAGGAVQAALESGKVGLQKVPKKGAIETNASYFYNLVRFRDL